LSIQGSWSIRSMHSKTGRAGFTRIELTGWGDGNLGLTSTWGDIVVGQVSDGGLYIHDAGLCRCGSAGQCGHTFVAGQEVQGSCNNVVAFRIKWGIINGHGSDAFTVWTVDGRCHWVVATVKT